MSWILTKTHCGGFCMDCPPSAYVFANASEFQRECFAGRRRYPNGTTEHVHYDTVPQVRPTRAVHVIRNPFDNIVGRLHLATQHQRQRMGNTNDTTQQPTLEWVDEKDPHTALLQWCDYLDRKYQSRERHVFSEEFMTKYGDIPCHAEWFRYIQWHNLATTVTTTEHLPVHYLWYDNYTTHWDATVTQLFAFLNLPIVSHATPCEWLGTNKTYANSVVPRQIQGPAARMMRDLAQPEAWKLVQHYLDPYVV